MIVCNLSNTLLLPSSAYSDTLKSVNYGVRGNTPNPEPGLLSPDPATHIACGSDLDMLGILSLLVLATPHSFVVRPLVPV